MLCLCGSVKGEILCCQKDFKINLFLPSEGDMILLMLTSEPGSRFRLHGDPTETRHPGTPVHTCAHLSAQLLSTVSIFH